MEVQVNLCCSTLPRPEGPNEPYNWGHIPDDGIPDPVIIPTGYINHEIAAIYRILA